jgi:cytochrome P450
VEIPGHTDARGRALETMREFANYAVVHLAPPPPFPTRRNLELRRALRTFHHFFDPLVRQRRAEGSDHGDLLSGLLQARDEETGTTLSDRQVGDNVLSYFMAAHEPIALTLAWALHLLARHPAECERLRAEAAAAADPARLPYTRMVLEETLRLYPSVWMFTRNAQRRDTIGGYDIPAGSIVFLSPFVTHRHPEAWPEPEAFRPGRFSPEARAAHHPFGYFPFAAGPHECIGRHFAMMAMQMILPTLVRHFRFRAVGGEVGVEAVVTVRPRGGVRVSLESIHEAAHVAAVPLTV